MLEGEPLFIVTLHNHNHAVERTMELAEGVVADLLSDTGVDAIEGDIDIEEWRVGEVHTFDEGEDYMYHA